ncbi:tRNA lysidine(34) synthetase TilS [Roseibium salinum]|uniref:tRNA lysidine(34) synthetase TilS n=1 Tax=Roseibium salinum TaxID=1604349 RepID=UPI00362018EA
MACWFFSEWRERVSWQGDAEVLCVDHGLRPESAAEAEFVAGAAAEHGLSCRILRWTGEKPASNIQDEARRARYRLFADHMAQSGAEALVLAHHMDDQAETFLDRLTRGSGLSGLSAMAADEPHGPQGLRLLRPFLNLRKERLEASLRERGLSWCLDPSNQDPKYKRSRLRKITSLLAEEGLTPERIARTADHLRRAREALEATVRDLAARHVAEHAAGPLRMSREAYAGIAEDLRLRLLNHVVGRVTGVHPRIRFQKLQALDAALIREPSCRHTLAGALIEVDAGRIHIWREAGRAPPETLVITTEAGIWDNRYGYSLSRGPLPQETDAGLLIGPLCNAPVPAKQIRWPEGWPKEAFACSPAVWSRDGVLVASCVPVEQLSVSNDDSIQLDLERLPIQAKLTATFVDDGDTDGGI